MAIKTKEKMNIQLSPPIFFIASNNFSIPTIYNYPRKIQTIGISSSFKIIVNCRYEINSKTNSAITVYSTC